MTTYEHFRFVNIFLEHITEFLVSHPFNKLNKGKIIRIPFVQKHTTQPYGEVTYFWFMSPAKTSKSYVTKTYIQQECIPVGCVPSAAVASVGVYPSMHWAGGCVSQHIHCIHGGVCLGEGLCMYVCQGGVCPGRGCLPGRCLPKSMLGDTSPCVSPEGCLPQCMLRYTPPDRIIDTRL